MAGGPSPFSGSTKTTLHVHTAIKALSAMISSPHQSQSDSSQTNMFNSQHHSPDFTEALAAVHHIERQQQHHHHQPPSAHDHDSSVSTPPDSSDSLRQRRESRKMGEKRRRDYIQAGMTELSKLVPECTNKSQGEVLQKSINFINQLKQSESQNIDRWTLEKMLADQAINDLSAYIEYLKAENDQLRSTITKLGGTPPARLQSPPSLPLHPAIASSSQAGSSHSTQTSGPQSIMSGVPSLPPHLAALSNLSNFSSLTHLPNASQMPNLTQHPASSSVATSSAANSSSYPAFPVPHPLSAYFAFGRLLGMERREAQRSDGAGNLSRQVTGDNEEDDDEK